MGCVRITRGPFQNIVWEFLMIFVAVDCLADVEYFHASLDVRPVYQGFVSDSLCHDHVFQIVELLVFAHSAFPVRYRVCLFQTTILLVALCVQKSVCQSASDRDVIRFTRKVLYYSNF